MRHFATTSSVSMLLFAGLSGCAAMTPRESVATPAPEQPLAHMTVATPAADHDVLAQLMAAQFALDHNDLPAAAKAYAQAAKLSNDPKVAGRAVSLAIATHDTAGVGPLIARWQKLGATPAHLAEARAKLALNSGDTDEARRQLDA